MNRKKLVKKRYLKISIKLLFVFFLIFGLYISEKSFSNTISLLSVSESENGKIIGSNLIDLSLYVKRGTGNIYINLNNIKDIDTQISIINSQKLACEIFELECNKYDFYYNFDSNALFLKGPSASSSIAILTAKTLKGEKIDKTIAMTGALNSGGIIGNVGGIEEKIKLAEQKGFDKILIPYFSDYNDSINHDIEILKVFDIVETYNQYGGKKFEEKNYEIDTNSYSLIMKDLAESLCSITENYLDLVDLEENNTRIKTALNMYNSSLNAKLNENYYSMGSFCYSSNLNLRSYLEIKLNLSGFERDNKINEFEKIFYEKYLEIYSNEYKKKIISMNDFYVYLLIVDRLEEVKEFINLSKNQKKLSPIEIIQNSSLENNSLNVEEKDIYYSYALERFSTISLWENFIQNEGPVIKHDTNQVSIACEKINRQISIKKELINSYGINLFNEEFQKQLELNRLINQEYLCLYRGFQLDAKINTILNSVGIEENNSVEILNDYSNFTYQRLGKNSEGTFPIIPYIYYEYAQDLIETDKYSAYLYLNYALSFSDLNVYLEKEIKVEDFIHLYFIEIFQKQKYIFLSLFLLIIAIW